MFGGQISESLLLSVSITISGVLIRTFWLSWFAVEPSLQRQGHGRALLKAIESIALDHGYRKFLVETYTHVDFTSARGFYASQGFSEVGRISNYLHDGSDMIVYGKELKFP